MTGDVEPRELVDALEDALASLPDPGTTGPDIGPDEPRPPEGAVDEPAARPGQSSVAIGLAGPKLGTPDSVALHVVTSAMGMMGGRLWTAMRERPPHAYFAQAIPVPQRHGGALVCYVTTPPGQEDAAVEAFLSELGRVAEDGLTEEELERGRRHLSGLMTISMQRGATRVAGYALAEVSGVGYERVEFLPELVRGVTTLDAARAARRYMSAEEPRATVVLRG